ncbi:MAG: hypothetical protein ACOCQQ_00040 [Candidatus Nanoarchaeia archaeon]
MIPFENQLIASICEKKELRSLDRSYVLTQLHQVLREEQITLQKYEAFASKYNSFKNYKRSALYKKLISLTRKKLRVAYGVYVKQPLRNFKKIILDLDSFCDKRIEKILCSHQSSRERFSHYEAVYQKIFEELEKFDFPKTYSLLDLACGYNPFSYCYFSKKPTNYTAVDLSKEDMFLVQDFFKQTGIKGSAYSFSLLSNEFLKWFSMQKSTLCFFLKTLDSIEQKKRHYSKTLLDACPSRFMVVSFPLVCISGKSLDMNVRGWLERFIKKQKWKYSSFLQADELFYIIKK